MAALPQRRQESGELLPQIAGLDLALIKALFRGQGRPAASIWRRIGLVAKARRCVQLLQMEQKGAVVPALVALVVERLEHIAHRVDDRQLWQPNLRGRGQNRVEVLDEVAHRRAWPEVAIDHAPAVLLEHAAVGMAAGQCHRDLGGSAPPAPANKRPCATLATSHSSYDCPYS